MKTYRNITIQNERMEDGTECRDNMKNEKHIEKNQRNHTRINTIHKQHKSKTKRKQYTNAYRNKTNQNMHAQIKTTAN